MDAQDLTRLQAQSRWLRRGVTVLTGLLLLIFVLSLAADGFVGARDGGEDARARLRSLLAGGVYWLPGLFYFWSLLAVRRILGDVAAARHFQPALARGLRDIGVGLAAGALCSAVIQPNLMRLMQEAGWGRYIFAGYGHFDLAYAAVGTVGLSLVLLSRVLRRAAEMQAELDEII